MATPDNVVAGRTAIVGLGHTAQGELPGHSAEENAVDAALLALADAGLTVDDLDGLVACKSVQGQGNDVNVGALLGVNSAVRAVAGLRHVQLLAASGRHGDRQRMATRCC
jgi:hypothetical protein